MKTQKILIYSLTLLLFLSCNNINTEKQDKFQYLTEQFADLKMIRYKVPGFENLELRFCQELDDIEIEWPSINYNEDLLFPRYIFLSYSIDNIDYKQVFSTFR